MNHVNAGSILYLISIIIFVLAVFGVQIASVSPLELVAAGLAFFAAGHLVP